MILFGLSSGLILLSPGKVYYGHGADIYEIDSILVTRYIWNRYNISTQYTWNRYDVNREYYESENDGFMQLLVPADGQSAGVNMEYNSFCNFVYTSKPQYTIDPSYNVSFKITNDPSKRYDVNDTIFISGTRTSSTRFSITAIDGYSDCWFAKISSNVASTSPPYYADRLQHFVAPHGAQVNSNRLDIAYGGDSKWFSANVRETRGQLNGAVSSLSSSTYPSNGVSGGYWYVSTGSSQTQGTFIDTVESRDPLTYPDNGMQDGYWYIKQ